MIATLRALALKRRFQTVQALAGVSVQVAPGEVLALLGPSGCGKSTLLRILAGLEHADSGEVWLGERRLDREPTHRRNIGLVFQELALFPHLSVADNIGFALAGRPRPEREARVQELLGTVGLPGLEDRWPHQLSGGQQQRVAVARALAPAPQALLLDEPFSSVDVSLRRHLRRQLRRLLRNTPTPVVLVTHDREDAFELATHIAVMRRGKVVQHGPPDALVAAPTSGFVAELLGDAATVEVLERLSGTSLRVSFGEIRSDRFENAAPSSNTLVLRPGALALDPEGPYVGHVEDVVFLGDGFRVELDASGARLGCRLPTRNVEIGERLRFRLDPRHVMLVA